MVERSPFTVEMDAMNSFNVDLLPSTIVKIGVDPCWRSVDVMSIRVQNMDEVAFFFCRELDLSMLILVLYGCRRKGVWN